MGLFADTLQVQPRNAKAEITHISARLHQWFVPAV
jgi:hypothetical protein